MMMKIDRRDMGPGQMFHVPDHWRPIPWSWQDKEIGRRCGEIQPVVSHQIAVTCSRRDGHPGVCIGGRRWAGAEQTEYWAWW